MSEEMIWFGLTILYFLPTVIAYHNQKIDRGAITLLNIFLGWTIIGWVVALVWSSMKDKGENK